MLSGVYLYRQTVLHKICPDLFGEGCQLRRPYETQTMLPHTFCSRPTDATHRPPGKAYKRSWYATLVLLSAWLCTLLACSAQTSPSPELSSSPAVHLSTPLEPIRLLNRVTWGSNSTSARQLAEM